MSGFLGKLVLLVLVIVGVWLVFRAATRSAVPGKAKPRANRAGRQAGAETIEDMRACARCGTYVPAQGGQACGRGDCPLLPRV
ncbi:hypothetical protein [Zavarzinia sp. CC-PAN008]|uniref:hypothetical protein n=1 Tax=Zavarzinia sp. CC-PAN008 TaxID=3243332 RepID=UPI003F7459A1